MRSAIVSQPIDLALLLAGVAAHSNGATVLFTGSVRDVNDDRAVSGIDYQAYQGMAEEELGRIVEEACARFDTSHVVAEHRVGTLSLGDVSVAVAAAHPRRDGAFDAARYVIEQIKVRLPIWKLEHYVDGTREWVDSTRATVTR
jgi:molybdopterin synthase catalytic subunit